MAADDVMGNRWTMWPTALPGAVPGAWVGIRPWPGVDMGKAPTRACAGGAEVAIQSSRQAGRSRALGAACLGRNHRSIPLDLPGGQSAAFAGRRQMRQGTILMNAKVCSKGSAGGKRGQSKMAAEVPGEGGEDRDRDAAADGA